MFIYFHANLIRTMAMHINDKETAADQSQDYSIDIDDTNEPYETILENSSNYNEDIKTENNLNSDNIE